MQFVKTEAMDGRAAIYINSSSLLCVVGSAGIKPAKVILAGGIEIAITSSAEQIVKAFTSNEMQSVIEVKS
jgi:hypothetical protein